MLNNNDMLLLIERGLELLIGLTTLMAFKVKIGGNSGITIKDLLKELEEKDREIERLKIQVHAWKLRHDHATNTDKKDRLHNE